MLFGLGTDLIVAPKDQASALERVASILASNKKKQAKYDADLKAYNTAVAQRAAVQKLIDADTLAYKSAAQSYGSAASSIQQRNQTALMAYDRMYAEWQTKKKAYDSVVTTRAQMVAADKKQSDSIVSQVGAPPGYTGCITPAQRDAYAAACKAAQRTQASVRGLGIGLGASLESTANCGWQSLPLCRALPALPASPGSAPQKPVAQPMPKPPVAPAARTMPKLPGRPLMPVLTSVPNVIVKPDAPVPAEIQGPRSLAVAGLLALVIVGGGAAYYLTRPKKKAAA